MSFRLALARLALGSTLVAASGSALANDRCAIDQVSIVPTQVVVNYDPFAASTTISNFDISTTTRDCPDSRNLFLELDPVDVSASNGTEIRLTNGSGTSLLAWLTEQGGRRAHGRDEFFNIKAGNSRFSVHLARGQVVPPGTYRVAMQAEARLNNGRNTPDVQAPFEIVVIVGPAIGLVPVTGISLELGELRSGRSAAVPVSFDAYANVPYRLTILSDRGFALQRDGATTGNGAAYVPKLDLSNLAVTSPQRDFLRPGSSEWRRRHSLDVEVGSIAGLPAGSYKDTITVEISARLGE